MSSSPTGGGFNWGQLAPDDLPRLQPAQKAHLARQVRIMRAAGKRDCEIGSWLQQNGLSADEVGVFLGRFADSGHSDQWERFCGRASLVLIAVLSVAVLVLVVVQRPWDGNRWIWRTGPLATEIDPVVGFLAFCVLYPAAMVALWCLATWFGAFLDRLAD